MPAATATPMPKYATNNSPKEFDWLATRNASPPAAAPAIITSRASTRSSSHPTNGAERPNDTASTLGSVATRAWLHLKYLSKAGWNTGAVL